MGSPSTDWHCCSAAFPCTLGGGDCDNDGQCDGNLVCGSDNCANDFSSNGHNPVWGTGADCCRGDLNDSNAITILDILFSIPNFPFCVL